MKRLVDGALGIIQVFGQRPALALDIHKPLAMKNEFAQEPLVPGIRRLQREQFFARHPGRRDNGIELAHDEYLTIRNTTIAAPTHSRYSFHSCFVIRISRPPRRRYAPRSRIPARRTSRISRASCPADT